MLHYTVCWWQSNCPRRLICLFIFYGGFLLFSLTGRLKPLSWCLWLYSRKTPWTGHQSLQGHHSDKHITSTLWAILTQGALNFITSRSRLATTTVHYNWAEHLDKLISMWNRSWPQAEIRTGDKENEKHQNPFHDIRPSWSPRKALVLLGKDTVDPEELP